MCGRFTLTASPEEVELFFSLTDLEAFPPRYNIAPTQPILIVAPGETPEPGANRSGRVGKLVRWGLLPSWVKDPKDFPLLINARSETAASKNSFRAAMRHRRALLPASGFYEWKREGKAKAQPYFIRPRNGGLVAFAALWESYLAPDGSEIETGAILTTAANQQLAPIHDRMPVVIKPEDFARWLDCRDNEPADVAALLEPVEPDFFETIPVSTLVNKVANSGPEVQEPVGLADAVETKPKRGAKPRDGGGQMSLL